MKWKKEGLIYAPTDELWWSKRYAGLPTVGHIDDERIRVYFWSVVDNMDGRIGYVDLDAHDPKRILRISKEPVLDIGEIGTFDDCGVVPCCVIPVNNKMYLYYIGVQRCEKVPYMYFAGLAISEDGEHFERYSRTPILDRTDREPYIRSAVTVLKEGAFFRAWYVSAHKWITVNKKLYPSYVIQSAESDDGIHWVSDGNICISFQDENEFGFGRPWVIKEDTIYKMWYSIRSKVQPYRIGYAESHDGKHWTRKDDEVGIERSDSGWDSKMICYPCVVDVKGKRYMFYNGNRHGASGFGYAVLES